MCGLHYLTDHKLTQAPGGKRKRRAETENGNGKRK